MSFQFRVTKPYSPFPGVARRQGFAIRKGEEVGFYLTVSPVSLHLSTEDNRLGRRLIAQFSSAIGSQPTLKYRDRKGDYRDLTAEWFPRANDKFVVERLLDHLKIGYQVEETR